MSEESKPQQQPRLTLYVLAQHMTMGDAKSAKLPEGARLVESLHLERLTDECAVSVLYKGKLQGRVVVSQHWDGGGLRRPSFIQELAKAALPLIVRVQGDVVTARWA